MKPVKIRKPALPVRAGECLEKGERLPIGAIPRPYGRGLKALETGRRGRLAGVVLIV
jgi:hypothetical protein